MTIGPRWIAAAILLAVLPAGCVRTAEGPQEEQRNAFYLAGKERLQAMDYQGAVDSFERALQENPRSVLSHFELGVLYDTRLADYAAALYHYNKAIKLRPTGYPADTIRNRIPACRQELIKADSLAVTNPTVLRETEKLREENQELRRQLAELKATLASSPSSPNRTGAPGRATTNAVTTGSGSLTAAGGNLPVRGGATGPGAAAGSAATADGVRYHTVLPRETLAGIARAHNVRIDALLAANRGLDPKRLKIGQLVKVPAPAH